MNFINYQVDCYDDAHALKHTSFDVLAAVVLGRHTKSQSGIIIRTSEDVVATPSDSVLPTLFAEFDSVKLSRQEENPYLFSLRNDVEQNITTDGGITLIIVTAV